MFLITLSTVFVALYVTLIRIFKLGWKSIAVFQAEELSPEEKINVSVVVSCKNEEKSLPHLISALKNQTHQDFELVLINDHSTDRTEEIMRESLSFFQSAIYLQAEGCGKKRAIAEAISRSSGDLIITTDADCIPVRTWIETIVKFQTKYPSHLIIGPVKLSDKRSLFARLQQFEFTSLVASGAGAAGAQMPIMCNAANMAFDKNAWLASKQDLKPEEQSGDDVFLLQSIKKRGGIIRFLRSEKAFVSTEPAENLRAFIHQRRRWAGKSTAYTDWHSIAVACIVFGLCSVLLLLLALAFSNALYLYFFLFFFLLKYWMDERFLNEVSDFYSLKSTAFYSFCLSLVYPFYIVFTAISALFFKPRKW